MEKHINKFVAPVIVTICLIVYYIICGIVILRLNIPNIIKIIALIFSIILSIVIIMVLVERIKEIKGGEEDDLSKY
jgi:hypothetical protein